jgi:hypothetical protein
MTSGRVIKIAIQTLLNTCGMFDTFAILPATDHVSHRYELLITFS